MEDMAHDLGFRTPTISRWITGSRTPDPQSCFRLAKAMDTPVLEVLRMAGHSDTCDMLLTAVDEINAAAKTAA